jgi:hypothetical protein
MQSSFQVDLSGSIGVGLNKELKVVQVASGSSAEAAGMPLGSRIIAIDGVQVHEYADAAREMQAARSLGNAMCTVAFAFPKDSEESDSGHDISGQANNERERSDTKNANSPHIPSTNRVAHRHGVSHKKQPTQQTFRLSTATLADLAAATAEALRPAPEATAGWFAKDVEATYKAALGQDVRQGYVKCSARIRPRECFTFPPFASITFNSAHLMYFRLSLFFCIPSLLPFLIHLFVTEHMLT